MPDAGIRGARLACLAGIAVLAVLLPACSTRRAPAPAGGKVKVKTPPGTLDPIEFSELDVTVGAITGSVRLDAPHEAKLKVKATNNSAGPVEIRFRGGAPARDGIPAGSKATVEPPASVQTQGRSGGVRVVRLDLAVQIDRRTTPRPVGEVEVDFLLPPGVPALLRSNRPVTAIPPVGGRAVYRLKLADVHMTWIQLVYAVDGVTLEIRKSIADDTITAAGPVTVSLSVENVSTEDAVNVVLRDTFDPNRFEGSGPEFALPTGAGPGVRLIWSRTVSLIPAGGTWTGSFTVAARGAVPASALQAAVAHIGNRLVGVSNVVRLR